MVHLLVERLRELLNGFTRVTFSGCGGDPGVFEQSAIRRQRERSSRLLPPAGPHASGGTSPGTPHTVRAGRARR